MKLKAVSGIMLTLLLVGIFIFTFNIQPVRSDWTWTETIYIRADGSVEPDTAPISSVDNVTYTLTDNIVGDVPEGTSAIVVERDNIVVDGAGYTLQGARESGCGILLSGRSNVTIENMKIKAFVRGVDLSQSSHNTISENVITNTTVGVELQLSSIENTVSGNNITQSVDGIFLYTNSNANIISGNNIKDNHHGIDCETHYDVISGNNITNNGDGITLWGGKNGSIYENNIANNIRGIWLCWALDNIIYHNNIIDNAQQVADASWSIPSYLPSINIWDDGYPSGGNYWSDHVCTGNPSDGSQPYIIDPDNIDRYPFQNPNGWLLPPPPPVGGKATPINMPLNNTETPALWILLTTVITSLGVMAGYVKKRKRNTRINS